MSAETFAARDAREAADRQREFQRNQQVTALHRQQSTAASALARIESRHEKLEQQAAPLRARRTAIERELQNLGEVPDDGRAADRWHTHRDNLTHELAELTGGQSMYGNLDISRYVTNRGLSFIESDLARLEVERTVQQRQIAEAERALQDLGLAVPRTTTTG